MIPDLFDPFAEADAAVRGSALEKRYGRRVALAGLDLTVPEGAVYVLAGPNGAGKTTVLRVLLDLARADRGEARVFGLSTIDDGPSVRARIGYVAEDRRVSLPGYRVGEVLRHHAAYFPAWEPEYAEALVRTLEIDPGARYATLSKGQALRVQLVLALAHRPPLLLLDEPTDGLDPLARDRALGILAEHLASSPTTVLIATHRVDEMEGLGDHLGVLRHGRLVAQMARSTMDNRLLSVRGEVADGAEGVPPFPVLAHVRRGREHAWTLWTDGEPIESRLEAGGIVVRSAEPLTLEAATRTFLALELSP